MKTQLQLKQTSVKIGTTAEPEYGILHWQDWVCKVAASISQVAKPRQYFAMEFVVIQLKMERTSDGELPRIPLPEGYSLRTYRPGDEHSLARIYEYSDLGSATPESLRKNILSHPCFRPERILVLEHEGQVVGTSAAWVEPSDPGAGYLHMVGVLPEHQGKRLGKLLTLEAMRLSQQEGFSTLRLVTDDWRLAAIRVYLGLGYVPLLMHPTHRSRWELIGHRLDHPGILDDAREALPQAAPGILKRLFQAFGF